MRKTSVNWVLCCLPFGSTMNLGEPLMGISNLGDWRYVNVVWCAYSKFQLEIRSKKREREWERGRNLVQNKLQSLKLKRTPWLVNNVLCETNENHATSQNDTGFLTGERMVFSDFFFK